MHPPGHSRKKNDPKIFGWPGVFSVLPISPACPLSLFYISLSSSFWFRSSCYMKKCSFVYEHWQIPKKVRYTTLVVSGLMFCKMQQTKLNVIECISSAERLLFAYIGFISILERAIVSIATVHDGKTFPVQIDRL